MPNKVSLENMKQLSFSTFQLFVGNTYAELENFKINDAWNQNFEDQYHTIHSVNCSLIENRYFTLYDNYGSPNPRPEKIYDIPTKRKLNNPRKNNQAELNKQLFCMYDTYKHVLFMNDSKKKKFLIRYLKNILSQEIIIKNIYKDIDEFTNALKTLDEITFSAQRNIFTAQVDSFKKIKDLFYIDEPESFSITAKYKINVKEKIKRAIENFRKEQVQAVNSCLICRGKDDHGIEQVFNENAFCKSIGIILTQNEEKLLDPKAVFDELIRKSEHV